MSAVSGGIRGGGDLEHGGALTLNGVEKLRAAANPDGTVSVNGTVYPDETAAGNAGGQALVATDLIPESAQAVAETLDMLMAENVSTSRGFAGAVIVVVIIVLSINFFWSIDKSPCEESSSTCAA